MNGFPAQSKDPIPAPKLLNTTSGGNASEAETLDTESNSELPQAAAART